MARETSTSSEVTEAPSIATEPSIGVGTTPSIWRPFAGHPDAHPTHRPDRVWDSGRRMAQAWRQDMRPDAWHWVAQSIGAPKQRRTAHRNPTPSNDDLLGKIC